MTKKNIFFSEFLRYLKNYMKSLAYLDNYSSRAERTSDVHWLAIGALDRFSIPERIHFHLSVSLCISPSKFFYSSQWMLKFDFM